MSHARQLLQRHLDGLASLAEQAELGRLLVECPAVADALAEATRTEALLEHCLRERRLVAAVAAALAAPPAPALRRRVPWRWCAAALVLVAAGARLGYLLVQTEARASAVVSGRVLVDGVEVARVPDGARVEVAGDAAAVLELSDGSHAELAPASAAVLRGRGGGARKVVALDRGGGTFRVPRGGWPFEIDTPLGKVRAAGAEFSVELYPVREEEEEFMRDRGAVLLVVAALVGQVEVQSNGHTYVLAPGKSLAFAEEGKPRYAKPAFVGTVVAADGKSLTVEGPASKKDGVVPRKVFTLSDATEFEYFGVAAGAKKPAVGYHASVWLEEGSAKAVRVRLGLKERVLTGVVAAVSADGRGLTLSSPPAEKGGAAVKTEVRLAPGAKLVYEEVDKDKRPTVGYYAQVWLKPGSTDTASGVVFHPKKPEDSPKKAKPEGDTKKPAPKDAKPKEGDKPAPKEGVVTAVSADGRGLKLSDPGVGEFKIRLAPGAKVVYQDVDKGKVPTVGYFAQVWLQPGSTDTASGVVFHPKKPEGSPRAKPEGGGKKPAPTDAKPKEGDKPDPKKAPEKDDGKKPEAPPKEKAKPDDGKKPAPKDAKPKEGDKPGAKKDAEKGADESSKPRRATKPARDPAPLAAAIDKEIDAALAKAKVPASPPADDAEFLRRVTLDLTGAVPTYRRTVAFLESKDPQKRKKLIDELLDGPDYGRHFAAVWRNRMVPPDGGAKGGKYGRDTFSSWLAEKFNDDVGWDQIVRELLTASGPVATTPQSAFILANSENSQPQPARLAAATAQLFWGVRLGCAECHNHPFASWKQADFWGTAAFFSRLSLTSSKDKERPPSLVEDDNPVAAVKGKKGAGAPEPPKGAAIVIPGGAKEGRVVRARFLGGVEPELDEAGPFRPRFAAWATSADNPYFANAAVNRMWGHFFGRGLVHPVDNFDPDNPPSHPALLKRLAAEFTASGFDLKHLARAICNSKAYQRTSRPLPGNAADATLFSRMALKVLTPEMLYDSLAVVIAADKTAPVRKPGGKGGKGPALAPREEFLRFFRTPGEAEPTEYSQGIPQLLRLLNGPLLNAGAPVVDRLCDEGASTEEAITTLYLTTLSRRPTAAEVKLMSGYLAKRKSARDGYNGVLWALLNSSEFALNH